MLSTPKKSETSEDNINTTANVVGSTPGTQQSEITAEISALRDLAVVQPRRREVERRSSGCSENGCENGCENGGWSRRGSRKARIEDAVCEGENEMAGSDEAFTPTDNRPSHTVTISDNSLLHSSSSSSSSTSPVGSSVSSSTNSALMERLGLRGSFPNLYTTMLRRLPPESPSPSVEDDGIDYELDGEEWDTSLGVHFYIPPPRVEGAHDLADDVLSGMGMGMGGVMGYGVKAAGGGGVSAGRKGQVGTMLIVRRITCLEDGRSSPAQRCGMLTPGDVVVGINGVKTWGVGVVELGEIVGREMKWREGGSMEVELTCVQGEGVDIIKEVEREDRMRDVMGREEGWAEEESPWNEGGGEGGNRTAKEESSMNGTDEVLTPGTPKLSVPFDPINGKGINPLPSTLTPQTGEREGRSVMEALGRIAREVGGGKGGVVQRGKEGQEVNGAAKLEDSLPPLPPSSPKTFKTETIKGKSTDTPKKINPLLEEARSVLGTENISLQDGEGREWVRELIKCYSSSIQPQSQDDEKEEEDSSRRNVTLDSLDESFKEGMEGMLGIKRPEVLNVGETETEGCMVPSKMPPRQLCRAVASDPSLYSAFADFFLEGERTWRGRDTGDMGAGEVEEVGRLVGGIARGWIETMETEGRAGEGEIARFVNCNAYFIAHEEDGGWKRERCAKLGKRKMYDAVEALVEVFPPAEDGLGVLVREGGRIIGDISKMRLVADEVEEEGFLDGSWVKEYVDFKGEDGESFLRELAKARRGGIVDSSVVDAVCSGDGKDILDIMVWKGVTTEAWWVEKVLTCAMEAGNEGVVEKVAVEGAGVCGGDAWEICFKGLVWLGDRRVERDEGGIVDLVIKLEGGDHAVGRWVEHRKGKIRFDAVLKEAVKGVGGIRGIDLIENYWEGKRGDLVEILRDVLTKSTEGNQGGLGKAWDKIRTRGIVDTIKATGWNQMPPSPQGVVKKVRREGEKEEQKGEGEGAWDLVRFGKC